MTELPEMTTPLPDELAERAMSARSAVFRSFASADEPLKATQRHRMILYPVQFDSEPRQFQAVAQAAGHAGDEGFFLHYTEAEEKRRDWYVPFTDFDGFVNTVTWDQTHVLYSPSGSWGILVDEDSYAVVGSRTKRFITQLASEFPPSRNGWPPGLEHAAGSGVDPEDQVLLFVSLFRRWSTGPEGLEPLRRILCHVYGAQRADELLESP